MPAIPADQADNVELEIPGASIELVAAAASDPVFASVTPDDYSAYVRFRFAHCMPVILGPESITGAIFALHPAAVAKAAPTIINKQMNRGHQMKYLGARQDSIVGCVLQAAFPEEPESGWVVPEDPDETPCIQAQGVLFKQAAGVDKMLGDHLSGKLKQSVSMEMFFYHTQTGLWDRQTGGIYDRGEIPTNLKGYLFEDDKGRLLVRKGSRAGSLVAVTGGRTGRLWFAGLGYTPTPAEPTAAVDAIAAERRGDLMLCSSIASMEWMPGMKATWAGGGWGRGVVLAAHYSGSHTMHRMSFTASDADPVLVFQLPDKVRVLRKASSVCRKF